MATLDLRERARAHMPALPQGPVLEKLAATGRATWFGRMVNEHTSHAVFEGLAKQLAAAGFSAEEIEQCKAFAEEEKRHGVLCGAVVEALGGEAIAEVPAPEDFPLHEDVPAVEGVIRNLLSISCMSETVAVSLIGAEREEMPEGELHTLLTKIWADEIGHARFGWAIVAREVPKLDAAARARLGAYLKVALSHLETHELAHLNPNAAPPAEGAALGLCNGNDARSLFYDTVEQVIVPRLEEIGLPARSAWEARLS